MYDCRLRKICQGLPRYAEILGKAMKKFIIGTACVFLACAANFSAQDSIRITLWALSEAIPGTPEFASPSDNPWAYAAKKIRETAPFLIEGMAYGWEFSYTPSDIGRSVAEQFSFQPFRTLTEGEIAGIEYTDPREKNNRVSCWVDFSLNESVARIKAQWNSASYRKIKGRGLAPLTDGFDGIKQAASDALKNAVRQYARGLEKNKPKEITGNVIIVGNPVIGLNAGRYQVELEFYLELKEIVPYSMY
jgi:hypothetical protein